MQITAAVVAQRSAPFAIETLQLDEPRAGEVLVQIVASGLCHTDLHGRDGYYGTPFPAVFGHEGAGIVVAAGTGVTKVVPGDHSRHHLVSVVRHLRELLGKDAGTLLEPTGPQDAGHEA